MVTARCQPTAGKLPEVNRAFNRRNLRFRLIIIFRALISLNTHLNLRVSLLKLTIITVVIFRFF